MARTLNPAKHAVKRDAFLDATQRLTLYRGYEAFSVQDVIHEVGASKGAFYHYFGSKSDLLEAVVERMADAVQVTWDEIMARPGLTAIERFESVFGATAQYKNERRELTLAVLEGWLAESNTVLREKLRALVANRLSPVLVAILQQGTADGEFSATDPEGTAHVLIALIQGLQEEASRLFVKRQAREIEFEDVERLFGAYAEALDRILGLRPGQLSLPDPPTLRTWFG
jgi:AcrR family transcriptional regulator